MMHDNAATDNLSTGHIGHSYLLCPQRVILQPTTSVIQPGCVVQYPVSWSPSGSVKL